MNRIYIVNHKASGLSRLVQAQNPGQAMHHVTNNLFSVKAASAVEVAELMTGGVAIEKSEKLRVRAAATEE